MKKLVLLFLSLLMIPIYMYPQQNKKPTKPVKTPLNESRKYCATDALHNALTKESPSYIKKFDEMNGNWQKWAIEKATTNSTKAEINHVLFQDETLPVIFHMMINGSTSPNPNASLTDGNLSQTQVQAALNILNQIYSGTATGSKAAGLNTHVQFCLAQVDAHGAAITSYTYTNPLTGPLDNTNQGQINTLSNVVQSTGKYPTTKYINIYVVDDITAPVAGFAYMPPAHGSAFDGIYIEAQYLLPPPSGPSDQAYNTTVLAHEMGHYLGLFHTFGICNTLSNTCSCYNNNCLFDGDMVCDTPPDFSQTPTAACSPTNTCNTDNTPTITDGTHPTTDVNDLINNYMDYGDWNCQYLFTQGQINRIHFMIDEFIGPRNSLLHSNVCNPLCANTTCTVTINPITTTSVSGVYYPNTLLLSGPSVSYNFTGNLCSSIYNTYNWSAYNLATNLLMTSGTGSSLNVTFTAVGNYRIILQSSVSGSNPLCSESDTLDIQVLPPPVCSANLDMSGGWNANNWQRTQYENGWVRTANNASTFKFGTTVMTTLPGTAPNGTTYSDPFSFVNTLAGDPNFSAIPLPSGVSTVMRVGKVIDPSTSLPPGDASYVTYTFIPTSQNAKMKVYYLGMKEHDNSSATLYYPYFATDGYAGAGGKTTFGFVCDYAFPSVSYAGTAHRGNTQTGASGGVFGKNDMLADGLHSPTFSTVTVGTRTVDVMSGWQSMILDFSDYACVSPTITITFFARSDDASTLGFHHSYAYFAAQCLPGLYKDIDLNLVNKDIACANNVTASCVTETLPIPVLSSVWDNGGNWDTYTDMLKVTVEESFDNITYTPSGSPSIQFTAPYPTPIVNLCKTPDNHPYKYFRVTYKTLCQTIVDTLTIFQGFVHTINDCAPNPMSGGHFINPPIAIGTRTISPDKYVQTCGTTTLSLGPPCWWHPGDPAPEYQWQIWYSNLGVTTESLVINSPSDNCTPYRRLAKYYDQYCNTSFWVPSDTFFVSSFQANPFIYSANGPDVCANSSATLNIVGFYESGNAYCDPEVAAQTATTNVQNSMSFSYYSNASCAPAYSITASSGPSVLTYTYNNFLTSPINPSFTFMNNGIYNATGTVYVLINVTRFGCASTYTIPITLKIKPSAIAGTIATTGNVCSNSTISITGDNPNATGYYWQYSYNSGFSPAYTLGSSIVSTTSVPPGTFTTFPVYVRRVANGTSDCPNPAYSNTLTIQNNVPTLTLSVTSPTICSGSCTTLSASGASTYTWTTGTSTVATTYSASVCPPTSTIYTATGTNTFGCVASKTIAVTVVATPTISVSSPTAVCAGNCAVVSASGANTYTWTAPPSTTIATGSLAVLCPTANTIYTVTGTNGGLCTSTKTISINVIAAPTITASPSTSLCAGACATLTAGGAKGWNWTAGAGTISSTYSVVVCPTVTTVYTVTGSNPSGCSSSLTVTVTVVPLPSLTVTPSSTLCAGTCTTLIASGASSYTWAAGTATLSNGTGIDACPRETTVYTVTGTNSQGCSASQTVTVTINPVPTLTASANNTICAGTCTTLTSGGASTYTWTAGTATVATTYSANVCPTVTTVYTVTGTNSYGCKAIKTVTITVLPSPTVTISGATSFCAGSSSTLTATGGGTYSWSPSGVTSNSLIVTSGGVNTVTVTGINGCKTVKSVTVTVNPIPYISATATNPTICYDSCTTISVTSEMLNYVPYALSWSPAVVGTGSLVTACPTVTTVYTVTATTKPHCTYSTTVAINTVDNNPDFYFTQAQVSNQTYYTVTAYPIVTNANTVPGFGDVWIVEEIDASGNSVPGTNSNTGTLPNPPCWWVYPGSNSFPGYTGIANVNCGPGPSYNTPNPTAGQFIKGHNYRITRGTWNQYCGWAQISHTVTANGSKPSGNTNGPDYSHVKNTAVSANPYGANTEVLNVFPNPSNGVLNVTLDHAAKTEYTIEIFDGYGNLIFRSSELLNARSDFKTEIDLRSLKLAKGLYMINVNSGNQVLSKKVIID